MEHRRCGVLAYCFAEGDFPTAATLASDHNTQLIHLMPKWNQKARATQCVSALGRLTAGPTPTMDNKPMQADTP
eukprot:1883538-Karenia_brevis.AAC.1